MYHKIGIDPARNINAEYVLAEDGLASQLVRDGMRVSVQKGSRKEMQKTID